MTSKNVHQRLAQAMGAVKYIQNEKKQGMQYRIVSHDKVTAKVRPALLEAGIVYYPVRCDYAQNGNRTECSVTVRFVNVDEPSDFFDVPTLGFGVDAQDKGPGKAMSYAVKYALLKALGLETGEDPDEDADAPPYSPQNPHEPPFNAIATRDRIKTKVERAQSRDELSHINGEEQDDLARLKELDPPKYLECVNAFKVAGERVSPRREAAE